MMSGKPVGYQRWRTALHTLADGCRIAARSGAASASTPGPGAV